MVDVHTRTAYLKRRPSLSEVDQRHGAQWLHRSRPTRRPPPPFVDPSQSFDPEELPYIDLFRSSDRALVRIMLAHDTEPRVRPPRPAWPPSPFQLKADSQEASSGSWRDAQSREWSAIPRLNAPQQQPALVASALGRLSDDNEQSRSDPGYRDKARYERLREKGWVRFNKDTGRSAILTIEGNKWIIGRNLSLATAGGSGSRPLLQSSTKGSFHTATQLGEIPLIAVATVFRVGKTSREEARAARHALPKELFDAGRRITAEQEVRREYNWAFALKSPFAPMAIVAAQHNRFVICPTARNDVRSAIDAFERELDGCMLKVPRWLNEAVKGQSYSSIEMLRHLAACHSLGQIARQLDKLWQLRCEADSDWDVGHEANGSRAMRNGVHGDIKLENLLIDDDFNVWLNDFGTTRNFQGSSDERHGTPPYMAPEILIFNAFEGRPLDAWALGFAAFQLLVGTRTSRSSSGLPLDWLPRGLDLTGRGSRQEQQNQW